MKKAIIVGATSGLGYQLAKTLAEQGYKVGITGRRQQELERLKATAPDKFVSSAFDCTQVDNAIKLSELTAALGGLDLLILSSGRGDENENLDSTIENATNQLNVMAFTTIVTWAFNYFNRQGKGHLVAISSIAGMRGGRIAPAYAASKAYQVSYLQGLRQKAGHSRKPIYVTDIRPGFVDTAMAKGDHKFWVASKEKAARQIFKLIQSKRGVGYVTKRWRLFAIILRGMPNFIFNRL